MSIYRRIVKRLGRHPEPKPESYRTGQTVKVTQSWIGEVIGAWESEPGNGEWTLQVRPPMTHHWQVIHLPSQSSAVEVISQTCTFTERSREGEY